MKIRDFYALPIGVSFAKDDFYNYKLDKSLTEDGDWIIMIAQKGNVWGPSVFVHPYEDFVYEEKYRWRDGYFKYKTVTYGMHMGAFHVHSDNYQYSLKDIHLIPRGSFKEYVSKEISL